jgi:uncharacterized protein (DUF302 family)
MANDLGFEVTLAQPYEQAIESVTAALKTEGFGVLTRIDVRATLKEKIGADFRPYVILGACNPNLAHQSLEIAPEIGLLLPCNVTVEAAGENSSLVRIVNPRSMLAAAGRPEDANLQAVASQAAAKMERVVSVLKSAQQLS